MLGTHEVFHVGRVVEDLGVAMRAIGESLAITWAPVQVRTIAILTGSGEHRDEPIRFTYSADGPPHVELIEPGPGSLWHASADAGLHHIGVFADDVTAPPGPGMVLEFGGRLDGRLGGFAYYAAADGMRVELVEASRRASFAAWFAGGELAPARPPARR